MAENKSVRQISVYIYEHQFEKLRNQPNKSEVVREALEMYFNKEGAGKND